MVKHAYLLTHLTPPENVYYNLIEMHTYYFDFLSSTWYVFPSFPLSPYPFSLFHTPHHNTPIPQHNDSQLQS